MAKITRLTPHMLRKMVLNEKAKLKRRLRLETLEQNKGEPENTDTEEVGPSDLADSLEKDIDYIKALKVQEHRLRKKLRKISEAKKILRKKVLRKI